MLFDTNVILDVMLLRPPFYKVATLLISEVEKKNVEGYICSTTVTTIYYLVSKMKKRKETTQLMKNLLHVFHVSQVDKSIFESALNSKFSDYEDAVLHESALKAGLDGIVTRDGKDFRNASITVLDPEELLKIMRSVQ